MTVFTDNWFGLQKVAKMLDHGGIHGNATGQNQWCVYFRIGNERVNDIFCQAFAQPVADLPYGITFLLA